MDFSLNLGVLDEGKLVKIDENKLYDVTVIGADRQQFQQPYILWEKDFQLQW